MTTNPTAAPSGTVRPPVPGGRHRITDYDALIDELAYTYDGTFSKASIAQAVAEARATLQPTARIPDFLPILVARSAREQLTAAAQAAGKITKPVPELLFVCVQNAGRSQIWRPRSPSTCQPAAFTSVLPGRTRSIRSIP